jgi:cytochrome c-type biogenesis protein CcmH/NrfF
VRTVSWIAIAVVAIGTLAYGTIDSRGEPALADRVESIAATIRCPACSGQSAANSDTSAARAVRREIAARLEDGESADDIRDYFASRYGESILLTPPESGAGSVVWALPVVVFVIAAAGLGYAFVRWRRT